MSVEMIDCYSCGKAIPEPESMCLQCFDCSMKEQGHESRLYMGMTIDPDTLESFDIVVRAYDSDHAADIIKLERPSHTLAGWPVIIR